MTGARSTAILINLDVFFSCECRAQGEVEVTTMLGRAAITAVYMWMMSVAYLFFSILYNNNRQDIGRHEQSLSVFESVLHLSVNLALLAAAITLLTGCVIVSMPTLTASTAFISTAAIARFIVDVTRLIRYVRGSITASGSRDRLRYPIQETGRG